MSEDYVHCGCTIRQPYQEQAYGIQIKKRAIARFLNLKDLYYKPS